MPFTPDSSHTNFLATPQTYQAHSCLRAFLFAFPLECSALTYFMAGFLSFFRLLLLINYVFMLFLFIISLFPIRLHVFLRTGTLSTWFSVWWPMLDVQSVFNIWDWMSEWTFVDYVHCKNPLPGFCNLCFFSRLTLISFDICVQSWYRHYNQGLTLYIVLWNYIKLIFVKLIVLIFKKINI